MGESASFSPAMIGQYVSMWHDIFGDDPEYVEDVIKTVAEPILIVEENIVMSGLLMIPYTIDLGEEKCQAYYIYGLLTNPQYRGMKYAEKIMHKAHAWAKQQGAEFCFLCPADDHLLKYYQYNGYSENVVDLSHCRPPLEDFNAYNSQLPRPAVLHSEGDWKIVEKYGSSGAPRPTQFISLGGRLVPTSITANCLLE